MAAGLNIRSAANLDGAYQALAAQKQTNAAKSLATSGVNSKAWQAAQDFEAVFLNTMFSQMFTGIDGDGPFGGSQALGVWRSFLTDEYAKSFAKQGGVGIASEVYKTLMAQQEVRGDTTSAAKELKS